MIDIFADKPEKVKRGRKGAPESVEPVFSPAFKVDKKIYVADSFTVQMCKLLNWYNYHKTQKQSQQYLCDYVKEKFGKDSFKKLEKIKETPTSIGWIARILSKCDKEPKRLREKFDTMLENLFSGQYKGIVEDPEKKVEKKPKKVDIQTIVRRKSSAIIAEIDAAIDEFITNKCKSTFKLESLFKSNALEMKAVYFHPIISKYKTLEEELNLAIKKKDDQLVEAYEFLTRVQLRKYHDFISSIITSAKELVGKAKEIKKSTGRKRRTKRITPEKQTAKVKYLKEIKEFGGFKSISPASIIGASQLWVYNTKKRKLGVYNANNVHGLSVKGTSILDYSTKTSTEKKIRKPEEFFKAFPEHGKVSLRKFFENIRAKDSSLRGRLNDDCLLLRIFS